MGSVRQKWNYGTWRSSGPTRAAWDGDGVTASDAGRAIGDLCDELAARVTELVGRRLRGVPLDTPLYPARIGPVRNDAGERPLP